MSEIFEEAFNLLCGDLLGEGCSRQVFACKIRPDLVVKVEESTNRIFANVTEQKLYDDTRHIKRITKWLAPCEFLSPDGRILLMKRCDPVPGNFKMPKMMPEFLNDMKKENYGILDGQLVCVDYGMYSSIISSKPGPVEWD